MEPCFLNVTPFPLTIVTLTADRAIHRVWYTQYQQPKGDQGAGLLDMQVHMEQVIDN
jgi:hypothetical protein